MLTPYDDLVQAFIDAMEKPEPRLTQLQPISNSAPLSDAPCCVICSPHPDDESLVGGLALRLRHELGWRVVNIAMTLGSAPARKQARWQEAKAACQYLGFELVSPYLEDGKSFEKIHPQAFEQQTTDWLDCVEQLKHQFLRYQPRLILTPHALDGHPAHCGTHHLVNQAVQQLPTNKKIHLAYSEYWNTQMSPRLMVALAPAHVAQMMTATAMHVGEVSRHPYHRSLPAWLMDGARRGAERVGIAGQASTGMHMAALYGWQVWEHGVLSDATPTLAHLGQDLNALFLN